MQHSWSNLHAHIFRSDGRVWRASLRHAVIDEGVLSIYTEFTDNGRKKHKLVSPITIAALQVFWVNVDVVSDDEGQEETAPFTPPRDCDRLPTLTMETTAAGVLSQMSAANTFVTMTTPETRRKPKTKRRSKRTS
jgi:hypothetical protein